MNITEFPETLRPLLAEILAERDSGSGWSAEKVHQHLDITLPILVQWVWDNVEGED